MMMALRVLLLLQLLLREALQLVVGMVDVSRPDLAARGSQHHRCSSVMSHVRRTKLNMNMDVCDFYSSVCQLF